MVSPYSAAVATSAAVVLTEARPAPADSSLQKSRADARIEAHAARHLDDIRSDLFGKLADFVDVANLEREESIGRVFDQLGRSKIGGNQGHRADIFLLVA